LQQAQRHQQDRRRPADPADFADHRQRMSAESRHQSDREGRGAHHHDGDQEGVFAADEIADPPEDDRAERRTRKPAA